MALADDAIFENQIHLGIVRAAGPGRKKDGYGGKTWFAAVVTEGSKDAKVTDAHLERMCKEEGPRVHLQGPPEELQYFCLGLVKSRCKATWGSIKRMAYEGVLRNYERYEEKLPAGEATIPFSSLGMVFLEHPVTYYDFAVLCVNNGIFQSPETYKFVSNVFSNPGGGLPTASMGLPAATMGLPAAAMGLPAADMGLAACAMGLPNAAMGLPAATMIQPGASTMFQPDASMGSGGGALGAPGAATDLSVACRGQVAQVRDMSLGGQSPLADSALEQETQGVEGLHHGTSDLLKSLLQEVQISGDPTSEESSSPEAVKSTPNTTFLLDEEVANLLEEVENMGDIDNTIIAKLKETMVKQRKKSREDQGINANLLKENEKLMLERDQMQKSVTREVMVSLAPSISKTIDENMKPMKAELKSMREEMEETRKNSSLQAEAMKSLSSFGSAAEQALKFAQGCGASGISGSGFGNGANGPNSAGGAAIGSMGSSADPPRGGATMGAAPMGTDTMGVATMGGSGMGGVGGYNGGFGGSMLPPTPGASPGFNPYTPPPPHFSYTDSLMAQNNALAQMARENQEPFKVSSGRVGLVSRQFQPPQPKRSRQ